MHQLYIKSDLALSVIIGLVGATQLCAQEVPRCEVIPEIGKVSFRIDGVEKTCWVFGASANYPRPFFYPLNGPSGQTLTRMGHPGAPDHDHHQSVWFAHHDVEGESFWANDKGTTIRQQQWLAYEDGDDAAQLACLIGWYGKDGNELLQQELVVAILPAEKGQYELEIQSTFTPGAGREVTQLGKTNFGFLAVRVAKSVAERFGGGSLTDSEGRETEKNIFGKQANWMDYSGWIYSRPKSRGNRIATAEGITFMEHPDNVSYPTHWHVRADGWMGASPGMQRPINITSENPLQLRYSLFVHSGVCDADLIDTRHEAFSKRPAFEVIASPEPHVRHAIRRIGSQ
ncbi:MAG: PmoA family protein [Planctomycetota bacterium]|nr:PmoA family protein [Planctomycetota bacterium]